MAALLLVLSIVLGVCKSAVYNRYAKCAVPDAAGIFRFNAFSYGAAALLTLVFGIGGTVSLPTLLSAAAYAVTVFSLQALSVAAMTVGPMSLTSLFVLYGMIIPSVAGPIFWREPFGIPQIAGMAIMLASLWLLRTKDDGAQPAGRRWGIMAGLCFLLSGMAGLIEKVHQSTDGREERRMFLFCAFTLMLLFSLAGTLTLRKSAAKSAPVKSAVLLGAASGAVASVYSQINLTLAGRLDSLIYFPVANGGALLLTVLISTAVFHETLSGRRLAGFFMGLCAIILLSLPAA